MMFAGLPFALVVVAQAADAAAASPADAPAAIYGPAAPRAPKPAAAPVKPAEPCPPPASTGSSQEIVICAEKPHGYRIDPDVLKARREKKSAGRPTRPGPIAMKDNSCTVVGTAPCMNAPMINLLAAAATLAEMGQRLSKGEEIGSMFVTDPHPSEYQLYLEAKHDREAAEAEKAKAVKAKAAAAEKAQRAAKPAQ
ncbi:MAG: hypothetical protein ABI770_06350 [Sphingomicrobium sp.]